MKLELKVPTMACSACAETIATAVHARDPQATVDSDLDAKTVTVESVSLSEAIVRDAIVLAGYPVDA